MENLPARVPRSLFPDLVSAFVPSDTPPDAVLELGIIIEGENIPTREFAEYLILIDRLYGRLSSESLRSYAHSKRGRLEISEIHKSALEIIFRFIYGHTDTAAIIVILMFLRSLPKMFKITTEGMKNLADAYKSFEEAQKIYDEGRIPNQDRRHLEVFGSHEEGRINRANRKAIREEIGNESALANLDDERINQLVRLLDALLREENLHLHAPIRFARRRVIGVLLRIRRNNPS
jgi:hypothetical protein